MDTKVEQQTILLVDDEETFCRQAGAYLESEGYQVVMECNADLILDLYQKIDPDIVVLDVDLGHNLLDGRMLCASIVKTARYQQGSVGIILISGHYINTGDELAGFIVGADNYLTKPFELSQLAIRVSALSRRIHRLPVSRQLTSGSLSIDLDSREVRIGNTTIQLSKLEFNVLAYLAESPGTVRTKSDLLESVWSTTHVENTAVPKCISLIRKKLAPGNPDGFIKTVYGVGYRFVGDE